ncbi:hypothetical protein Pcinc_024859 [Petrolisthes cinctipes]|uniref:Uncharacterized protein n=1 Tax=Petrolisthes cinctipes TaxID=88211 RepID=A0AAE1FAF2_PETCI|nr:hypothetical protein Pcinc_024859 [Petrolisthes cinctipes]
MIKKELPKFNKRQLDLTKSPFVLNPLHNDRAMAPHSTDPGGAHMPPPRPPDLHTPTTGVKPVSTSPAVHPPLEQGTSRYSQNASYAMMRLPLEMAQSATFSSLSKIKNVQPQPDLDLKIQLLFLKGAIYEGINIIAYLDHWVIWDTSHELTAKAVSTATSLLSNLGFLIMS